MFNKGANLTTMLTGRSYQVCRLLSFDSLVFDDIKCLPQFAILYHLNKVMALWKISSLPVNCMRAGCLALISKQLYLLAISVINRNFYVRLLVKVVS